MTLTVWSASQKSSGIPNRIGKGEKCAGKMLCSIRQTDIHTESDQGL